jgi:hypothetical protein
MQGVALTEELGLEAKFVTNQERLEAICRVANNEGADPQTRLKSVLPLIELVERYRFVSETGLQLTTLIGAVKAVARARLSYGGLEQDVQDALNALLRAGRTVDHFLDLDALRVLDGVLEMTAPEHDEDRALQLVVVTVWQYVFMHYYWLEQNRSMADEARDSNGDSNRSG